MKKHLLALFFALLSLTLSAQEINLAGEWEVKLTQDPAAKDIVLPKKAGPTQNVMYHLTFLKPGDKTAGTIKLPGTLDEAGYGQVCTDTPVGCLARRYHFIGQARYTRTFDVPEALAGKPLQLTLERVMWESTLSIDGAKIGSRNSLGTPHVYELPPLSRGQHTITLDVDNTMRVRIGEKGHAYGEHMQTIWNGVLGEMTVKEKPLLQNVHVCAPYPISFLQVRYNGKPDLIQRAVVLDPKTQKTVTLIPQTTILSKDEAPLCVSAFDIAKAPKEFQQPWDEFSPTRYTLTLYGHNNTVLYSGFVAFRSLHRQGNELFINGKPLFVRGNLDNCHFPLTGYPAMNVEHWREIFIISKMRGINTIRFHSYCPPRAAFEAADQVGMYLAPEAGIWIDGWMPGGLTGIGKGDAALDEFVYAESKAIIDAYSSHPSFTMFCFGNELGTSHFERLGQWGAELKAYAAHGFAPSSNRFLFSASTARQITPADDYLVTHNYPGIGGVRERCETRTNWNYENNFSRTRVPTISHEIGQWPIYPLWSEIDQYTGVLAPRNLIELKLKDEKTNLMPLNALYHYASGMHNKLMYKDEIESLMRTPSCRGLELLGMQDYSGQGEALVGFLNSFYQDKGFFPPKEVRACFGPVVTLNAFDKYAYRQNESYRGKLMARNMGPDALKEVRINWKICDASGKILASSQGEVVRDLALGELGEFDQVAVPLKDFPTPARYTIHTVLTTRNGISLSEENVWPFWVFDNVIDTSVPKECADSVVVTHDYNEAVQAVRDHKNVLLFCAKLGNPKAKVSASWNGVYWSTTWFTNPNRQTLGLLLYKNHPLFKNFPCDGYGDWIWRDICRGAQAFERQPSQKVAVTPIAMPVPDFHRKARLSTIFETQIDSSRMVFCAYDLEKNAPEHQQLKRALIQYVCEGVFPEVDTLRLNELAVHFGAPPEPKVETKLPEEFGNAILYIACGERLHNTRKVLTTSSWSPTLDDAVAQSGVTYLCENVVVRATNTRAYWVVHVNSRVRIQTTAGQRGRIRVRFTDPNGEKRSGTVYFEGREYQVPEHNTNPDGNLWMEFDVDPEDCLDGYLQMTFKIIGGPDLLIDRFIYLPHVSSEK